MNGKVETRLVYWEHGADSPLLPPPTLIKPVQTGLPSSGPRKEIGAQDTKIKQKVVGTNPTGIALGANFAVKKSLHGHFDQLPHFFLTIHPSDYALSPFPE